MSFTGLISDPVALANYKRRLPAVGSAPNPRNTYDRDQLIAISKDPQRNPIPQMRQDDQTQTNTCAAHAGSNVRERTLLPLTVQLSRMFLYLQARYEFAQHFQDNGTSIQSIISVLTRLGIPREELFPWGTWVRSKTELDRLCTPELLADAAVRKIDTWTEATDDFDNAVARVLMGDPILWGTGWPFPNGQSGGHATAPLWAEWTGQDWNLLVFNSHQGNMVFRCSRNQYITAIRQSPFGAYHVEGTKNLRFDPKTQTLL